MDQSASVQLPGARCLLPTHDRPDSKTGDSPALNLFSARTWIASLHHPDHNKKVAGWEAEDLAVYRDNILGVLKPGD